MSKKSTKKSILEYNANYGNIPKDYMERLAWLYRNDNFTKKDLEKLLDMVDDIVHAEWDDITYIFYMDPQSSPRPYLNTKTFTFFVSGAKFNKQIFEEFMKIHSNIDIVISTPCIMTTKTYTRTPSGMSKIEKMAAELELLHNENSPDWDNLGKSYCDMVQGALVSNDSIVVKGSVEKFFSILPRIEVNVQYMTKYDCAYNKRTVENRKSFKENPKTKRNIPYIIGRRRDKDGSIEELL